MRAERELDVLTGDLGVAFASSSRKGAAGRDDWRAAGAPGALVDGGDGGVGEQVRGALRCGGVRVAPRGLAQVAHFLT